MQFSIILQFFLFFFSFFQLAFITTSEKSGGEEKWRDILILAKDKCRWTQTSALVMQKRKKKKYFKYVHKKYIICSRPPSMTFYIHIYDA